MWILTFEINEYDQYGKYFITGWNTKPTEEQILSLKLPDSDVDYILKGGGRQNMEHVWYNLQQINEGDVLDNFLK